MIRLMIAMIAAALLAGCSWSDVLVEEIDRLPAGASFGYQQGYEDGCKTGIADRGGLAFDRPRRRRDEARIRTEPDYAKGWEEGSRICSDRYAGLVLLRRGLD